VLNSNIPYGYVISGNDRIQGIFSLVTGQVFINAAKWLGRFLNRQIDQAFIPLSFHWSGLFICSDYPATLFNQEPGSGKNTCFN
jgi:hypothetical protein